MKHTILLLFTAVFSFMGSVALAEKPKSFFELSSPDIHGKMVNFSTYRGKVVLVVNTASKCGFTPQLKDLESLYKKYGPKGFVVLAFPSNDFKQETADNAAVESVATKEYGTSFPFFEKSVITGPNKNPIYSFLTEAKPGVLFKDVSWNFEKFLIGRQGQVIDRYSSITKPSSSTLTGAIEKALAEPF